MQSRTDLDICRAPPQDRTAGDARHAAARDLLPLARVVSDQARRHADMIGRTERRFGTPAIMHLARLLDDLWMAADSFVADVEESE